MGAESRLPTMNGKLRINTLNWLLTVNLSTCQSSPQVSRSLRPGYSRCSLLSTFQVASHAGLPADLLTKARPGTACGLADGH